MIVICVGDEEKAPCGLTPGKILLPPRDPTLIYQQFRTPNGPGVIKFRLPLLTHCVVNAIKQAMESWCHLCPSVL